jgi:hypothetical protein
MVNSAIAATVAMYKRVKTLVGEALEELALMNRYALADCFLADGSGQMVGLHSQPKVSHL